MSSRHSLYERQTSSELKRLSLNSDSSGALQILIDFGGMFYRCVEEVIA